MEEQGNRRLIAIVLGIVAGVVVAVVAYLVFLLFLFTPKAMVLKKPLKAPEEIPQETQVNTDKVLTLILGSDDLIWYYTGFAEVGQTLTSAPFGEAGIRSVIQTHVQSHIDPIVTIKPSSTSSYQNMVDILDEMAILKVKKYALIEMTEQDSLLLLGNQSK